MRKQIELTKKVAPPAYGQHGSSFTDTHAVPSTNFNKLHGPWFGKHIALWNVERAPVRSLQLV